MNPLSYGRQEILSEDINSVIEVLKGDFLTQGPAIEKFEKSFAQFIHAPNSIAVTNGTAALHLAALALGVSPGQKVLVTTNTFVASANCIRYCGADVEFVDINKKNLCLDLDLLEKQIKSAARGTYSGIVAVDFAGYPINMEKLRTIADRYALWIIEDACHAVGAQFLNSKNEWIYSGNGRYADASVFSFHPVKHIATGEGGIVVAKTDELAEKIRLLRTHGITKDSSKMSQIDGPWYYEMQELGFNYRISDILCALGTSQLRRIEQNLSRRQEIADRYNHELSDIPGLTLPQVEENFRHAYHLYVIHVENRADLFTHLKENKIYAQVHYIPVHQQPYYKKLYPNVSKPVAENHYRTAISLPMYHSLKSEEQTYVIQTVRKFFHV